MLFKYFSETKKTRKIFKNHKREHFNVFLTVTIRFSDENNNNNLINNYVKKHACK